MNSFTKFISIRKLSNAIQSLMKVEVSFSTLSYYLDYFSLSFLFFFLPIFSYNIKDQEQYPKKEGLKVKQLIQVTYASNKDEIEQRELRALVKASELLKCKNLLVITLDYEAEEEFKGRRLSLFLYGDFWLNSLIQKTI